MTARTLQVNRQSALDWPRTDAAPVPKAVAELYLRTMAHDASHFLLYPEEVRQVDSAEAMAGLFSEVAEKRRHLTFRSGGTSLNGQAQSDSVLVDTRSGFKASLVRDGGERVWCEPGVTIRFLNNVLRRYGRQMGPDPASEIAATVGGVLANNASGMSCGTERNSYRMLDSLEFVLPSGTTINTADEGANATFASKEPHLYAEILALRDELRARPDLVDEVRRQFSMKNTMGYGLNALLDFDDPAEIFAHLLVGSEGTLAFVSQMVFHTAPTRGHVATALWVFDDVYRAAEAIPELVRSGASALELMDSRSLKVAQAFESVPEAVSEIAIADHAALLVEYQSDSASGLEALVSRGEAIGSQLSVPTDFTSDPQVRAALWSVRKGLYATVAGARDPGVTALLEDVVVPVENLAKTVSELSELLGKFGYQDAVIFGHAKDGNLHFMVTDDFSTLAGKKRLKEFTEGLVQLVLRNGGSLKAEHGTGRAMAPFVERQYGSELYDMMVRIKRAADPLGILNPGVLIADDPEAHLRHIKKTPSVNPLFDRCVECGYCEPSCPSRELTLTPRTRIVAERETAMAKERGDFYLASALDEAYQYAGVDTCAVDGMCSVACPLDINTGDLVRQERAERADAPTQALWSLAASHWSLVTRLAGLALSVAKLLPPVLVTGATRALRAILGDGTVPLWTPDLPRGGKRRSRTARGLPARWKANTVEAVYVPSCLNTMFEAAPLPWKNGKSIKVSTQEDFQYLCGRVGVHLVVPDDIDSLCCGTPWSSKGVTRGYRDMRERVRRAMAVATRGGQLPIVCDNSSCTEGLVKMLREDGYEVIDSPVFLRDVVVPNLPKRSGRKWRAVVIHPTCSTTHLGSTQAVEDVAKQVAREARTPPNWGCCGFAGDRGMLYPQLTQSATKTEAEEVRDLPGGREGDLHVSSNRTCEIGMTRATDEEYVSLISAVAATVKG